MQPIVAALAQPQVSPSTMPSVKSDIAVASCRAPTRSGTVRRPGARLSVRVRFEASSARIPIGRFTRNASRQLLMSTSTPPSDGPSPAASAAEALHRATPCVRSGPGNACSTSASDAGTRIAAPRAWSTRAAIRNATLGAAEHSTEASVNSTMPHSNSRLRPSRRSVA